MTSQPGIESKTTGIVLVRSVCKDRDNFNNAVKYNLKIQNIFQVYHKGLDDIKTNSHHHLTFINVSFDYVGEQLYTASQHIPIC